MKTPSFKTIKEVYERLGQGLADQGWHLAYDTDTDNVDQATTLSLHSRFKNGTPKKGWDVELSHVKFAFDLMIDPDTGEDVYANVRPRQRPYVVRAKNFSTATFADLDYAVEIFLEQAMERVPAGS